MNIHEFQGKAILQTYGVPVQEGFIAENSSQAKMVVRALRKKFATEVFVVKAQIHAGGRGKAGGVKVAGSMHEVISIVENMIGMTLVTPQTGPAGKQVSKVFIARDVYYRGEHELKEFYLSILLDRNRSKYVIIYSASGGMDIEEIAEKNPDALFREWIDPCIGLHDFQLRKIAYRLGLTGQTNREMQKFVRSLWEAFISSDAQLIEINPLLKTSDERIVAVDCKVVLDDNALYRHPEQIAMRDITEEDPLEVEATENNLNYVRLDGNVGCMVNGAGLAMATMDLVKLSGGHPANFLDVGGGANAKTVEAGIRIILKDPNVKAILINIFGGIVRCDRVATGIVEAFKNLEKIEIPVIVRLQGTNSAEAKEIIEKSDLKIIPAVTFSDVALRVKNAVVNE